MNILVLEFITSVGGVQTVYKNILPCLAKEHKIYFLDPYKNKFDNELTVISNIEVLELPINSRPNLGWNGDLINKGSILLKFGLIYFKYLFKLLKLLKEKKINLIYVSGKKEIAFAYIFSKITGIKYVYHSHGFNSYKDISPIYRLFINNAEKIITVSNSVKNVLIQAKVKREKIKVIYNGLNIEIADRQCKDLILRKKSSTDFKVIFVGTIQPKKGVHTLIKAVNLLLRQGLNISLDILGDITTSIFEKYMKELILLSHEVDASKISFLGFRKNVYEYLNNVNLLVLPSIEESFGMVLLEAMYLSKPVIGSNIGGIPEVINDGVNGFLFEQNNELELSEKIKLMYSNEILCSNMGINGEKCVKSLFNSDKQAKEIIYIINEISSKGKIK